MYVLKLISCIKYADVSISPNSPTTALSFLSKVILKWKHLLEKKQFIYLTKKFLVTTLINIKFCKLISSKYLHVLSPSIHFDVHSE